MGVRMGDMMEGVGVVCGVFGYMTGKNDMGMFSVFCPGKNRHVLVFKKSFC